MTTNTLIFELSNLVPDTIDLDGPEIQAPINRALRTLYYDRSIEKTVRLAQRVLTPTFYRRQVLCEKGSEIVFPLDGKAFSMRIHGNGRYCIEDGNDVIVRTVNSPSGTAVIKYFIQKGGKITLWGNFAFTVYDFSVYSDIISEYLDDIPDGGPKKVFDLRRMCDDFMSFTSPPTDVKGNPIPSCRLFDGKVEVDSSFQGEIFLTYRRLPKHVDDEADKDYDIPKEYEHVLPFLVAYYLLIGVDDALAKYFKSVYDQHMEHIDKSSYEGLSLNYPDVTGWA